MTFNLFEQPSMQHAHIYEFTRSPYEALFYSDSFKFESNKKKIGVVDQFQGKRPLVLNKDFAVHEKELELQFVHTLILDSHILDAFHRFVSGKGKLDEDLKIVVVKFLKHVSELNCDYSPVFYLVENWAKSSKEQYLKTSTEKLTSLLTLHCMDENIFIEKEEIHVKEEALSHYFKQYSANSLDACAYKWAESFLNEGAFNHYISLTKVSYACLLKMVLIHFVNPSLNEKNILKKVDEFQKFLIEELDILLGREFNLSVYYFSNFAGKFINVQPNMKHSKAVKNLKATAWDLLLLRLPEFLLDPSTLPEVNTAYIVTSEEKLSSVGDMFNLESLFYSRPGSAGTPMISFESELFESIISKKNLDNMFKQLSDLSMERSINNDKSPIHEVKLDWLIDNLEHQLKYLCAN
jgi:hypothetical protein